MRFCAFFVLNSAFDDLVRNFFCSVEDDLSGFVFLKSQIY